MRLILIISFQVLIFKAGAQNPAPVSNLVEGGKVLVELVKVFRKNQNINNLAGKQNNNSDICFTNSTTDNLLIELFKKINDTTFREIPSALSLTINAHECLLELSPNVYHYKVFKKNNGNLILSLEGDLRLISNEKMEREIR